MNGERPDAVVLGELRDAHTITIVTIPSRADLQRDRYAHRTDNGRENLGHQRLVLQQCGAAKLAADFFRGTAHVQVDDLRAEVHVQARGFRKCLTV